MSGRAFSASLYDKATARFRVAALKVHVECGKFLAAETSDQALNSGSTALKYTVGSISEDQASIERLTDKRFAFHGKSVPVSSIALSGGAKVKGQASDKIKAKPLFFGFALSCPGLVNRLLNHIRKCCGIGFSGSAVRKFKECIEMTKNFVIARHLINVIEGYLRHNVRLSISNVVFSSGRFGSNRTSAAIFALPSVQVNNN